MMMSDNTSDTSLSTDLAQNSFVERCFNCNSTNDSNNAAAMSDLSTKHLLDDYVILQEADVVDNRTSVGSPMMPQPLYMNILAPEPSFCFSPECLNSTDASNTPNTPDSNNLPSTSSSDDAMGSFLETRFNDLILSCNSFSLLRNGSSATTGSGSSSNPSSVPLAKARRICEIRKELISKSFVTLNDHLPTIEVVLTPALLNLNVSSVDIAKVLSYLGWQIKSIRCADNTSSDHRSSTAQQDGVPLPLTSDRDHHRDEQILLEHHDRHTIVQHRAYFCSVLVKITNFVPSVDYDCLKRVVSLFLDAIDLWEQSLPVRSVARTICIMFDNDDEHFDISDLEHLFDSNASSTTNFQFELFNSMEDLHSNVNSELLTESFNGTYVMPRHRWLQFRQNLEPFMGACRCVAKKLSDIAVKVRQYDAVVTSPTASAEQFANIALELSDIRASLKQYKYLIYLLEEGDQVCSALQSDYTELEHCTSYCFATKKVVAFYTEVRKTMDSVSQCLDKRIAKFAILAKREELSETLDEHSAWLHNTATKLTEFTTLPENYEEVRDFAQKFFVFATSCETKCLAVEEDLELAKELSQSNLLPNQELEQFAEKIFRLSMNYSNTMSSLDRLKSLITDARDCFDLIEMVLDLAVDRNDLVFRLQRFLDSAIPDSDPILFPLEGVSPRLEPHSSDHSTRVSPVPKKKLTEREFDMATGLMSDIKLHYEQCRRFDETKFGKLLPLAEQVNHGELLEQAKKVHGNYVEGAENLNAIQVKLNQLIQPVASLTKSDPSMVNQPPATVAVLRNRPHPPLLEHSASTSCVEYPVVRLRQPSSGPSIRSADYACMSAINPHEFRLDQLQGGGGMNHNNCQCKRRSLSTSTAAAHAMQFAFSPCNHHRKSSFGQQTINSEPLPAYLNGVFGRSSVVEDRTQQVVSISENTIRRKLRERGANNNVKRSMQNLSPTFTSASELPPATNPVTRLRTEEILTPPEPAGSASFRRGTSPRSSLIERGRVYEKRHPANKSMTLDSALPPKSTKTASILSSMRLKHTSTSEGGTPSMSSHGGVPSGRSSNVTSKGKKFLQFLKRSKTCDEQSIRGITASMSATEHLSAYTAQVRGASASPVQFQLANNSSQHPLFVQCGGSREGSSSNLSSARSSSHHVSPAVIQQQLRGSRISTHQSHSLSTDEGYFNSDADLDDIGPPQHDAPLPPIEDCSDIEEEDQQLDGSIDRDLTDRATPSTSGHHHEVDMSSANEIPFVNMQWLNTIDSARKQQVLTAMELLSSEEAYVKNLGFVVTNYFPELDRDSTQLPMDLRGNKRMIFGNMDQLLRFHHNFFLPSLRSIMCQQDVSNWEQGIAECFLQFKNELQLYTSYSRNKPKSDALMRDVGNKFFANKAFQLTDRLGLSAHLLTPIQRIAKYDQLLRKLIETSTGSDADALNSLTMAHKMIEFRIRNGNDVLYLDTIKGYELSLNDAGLLLRQDIFHQVYMGAQRRGPCCRRVFLFEKMILFAKPKQSHKEGGGGGSGSQRTKEINQCKDVIKTDDLLLTESIDGPDFGLQFGISFRKPNAKQSYILQTTSESMKNDWVNDVSQLLWQQLNLSKDRKNAENKSLGLEGDKYDLSSSDSIENRTISGISMLNSSSFHSKKFGFDNSFMIMGQRRPTSLVSVESVSSSGVSSGTQNSWQSHFSGGTSIDLPSTLGTVHEHGEYAGGSTITTTSS